MDHPGGLLPPGQAFMSLQRGASLPGMYFRPLHPSDLEPLKELHHQLFPVDYDAEFFYRAVHSLDDIASWAAVAAALLPPSPLQLPSLRDFAAAPLGPISRGASAGAALSAAASHPAQPAGSLPNPPSRLLPGAAGGSGRGEQLAGFVTAKPFPISQVEARDRQLLGFADPAFDQDRLSYILTLGVAEGYRNAGIASRLVRLVVRHAAEAGCRCVYLHVISYNSTAIAFYRRLGFRDVALLPNFYVIRTGRQVNPHRQIYDAMLFAFPLNADIPWCLTPCTPPPVLDPAAALNSGSVLRAVGQQLAACVPPLAATCRPQAASKPRLLQSFEISAGGGGSAAAGGGDRGGAWRGGWEGRGGGGGVGGGNSSDSSDEGYWERYGSRGGAVNGGLGFGSEEGMVHRRVGPADEAPARQGALSGGRDRQPSRPPEWLKGLFARY